MSKINQIQAAILSLDPGAYQKLMDSYIMKKYGFSNIMPLGSHSGTNKVTKGTPDSFVQCTDGRFVLIAHGSVENHAYGKVQSDILNCLDTIKTGIIRLFNSQENIAFIEREIRTAWAKMKGQPVDIIFQFVATFYNVIPDEALSYLKTRIDILPEAHLDMQKYDFEKNSNYHTIRSKIIDILIGFKYTDHFIDAIQLALYYGGLQK